MSLIDPILGNPVTVPTLDGFGYNPFPDVQPFSQRAASGYQDSLEELLRFIQRRLIPYLVETNPQGTWDTNVTALVAAVNSALAAQNLSNATAIANALTAIAESQIIITDPAILAVLNQATTATRQWLDTRYAGKIDYAKVLGLNLIIAPPPLGNAMDDTAALMAVIAPLHTVGGTVLLQRGLYYANLDLANQFQQVRIIGQGIWATEIRSFSHDLLAATIKFNGGSGAVGGGGIEELRLSAADGETKKGRALVFSGTTGCTARHVQIRGSYFEAVVFWNERGSVGAGDFTEFNTFCDGDILGAYAPVVYICDNGVESFHGSGLVGNNTINIPTDMVGPIVTIGATALPYNAPMNFTVWFQSGHDNYLFNADVTSAGRDRSFYGDIRCESNNGIANSLMGRGTNRILFNGRISWLGTGTSKLGNIFLCRKIAYEGGVVWGELEPISSDAPLKNSPTLIAGNFEGDSLHLVAITITGPNYEYHSLLLIQKSVFDQTIGFMTELYRTQYLDSAAKGVPTFAFNNGLYCGNANYDPTFHAYATVTNMGGGRSHMLLSQTVNG